MGTVTAKRSELTWIPVPSYKLISPEKPKESEEVKSGSQQKPDLPAETPTARKTAEGRHNKEEIKEIDVNFDYSKLLRHLNTGFEVV
jgi:hypothetical protein